MFNLYKNISVLGACCSLAACFGGGTYIEEPTTQHQYTSVRGGFFNLTQDGSSLYPQLSGNAHLVVSNTDSSIEVRINGLTNDTVYNTHIHSGTCATGGGPHYLQNAQGTDEASNGLWPTVTVNSSGLGTGKVKQNFVVSADAKSVVIHQPGTNARIACADLNATQTTAGTFNIAPLGLNFYARVTGWAFLAANDAGSSKAELNVDGLTPGTAYVSHVHAQPCSVNVGGGHYLQDPSGSDVKENGLWPGVNIDTFGYGIGWASNPFKVRLNNAPSVVLHQTGSGEKIACADLTDNWLAFRSGSFKTTETGTALYGSITGRAHLKISSDGESQVKLYVSGLKPSQSYGSHVHNGACESGGGGHYLDDTAGKDEAANGLFPLFKTNSDGVGRGDAKNKFIVRPDARSVVIHEPGTGERIACADLN